MQESIILSNRYKLGSMIGSGGMAVVFKASDLMLERPVALKVLRKDYSKNPDFRERFRQEAKAAANLSHPNIVTVHDFGFDKESLFIVMEHVPGVTLKELIQKRGRFSTVEAIPIIVQACAGIGFAHRAGLIHCDVKPQNILVTPDQRVKVTDFGIARALVSIQADEQMDIVWGSPQYFSPEQATGRAPVPASDVYGLGVILYEMLTGHLPFDSLSTDELARLHINAIPKNPREHNPRIDDNLSLIILKVLSKEPTARYRTADQLGRVLISFSQKPGSIRTSQPRTFKRENIFNQSTQQDIANKKSESGIINPVGLDWKTIFLGLITLISVGGLIPFWLWIYFIMK